MKDLNYNQIFKLDASRDKNVQIPVSVSLPELNAGETCPVAIVLHGFLGNKDEWGFYYGATNEEIGFDSIALALMKKGIGTIRLDMPGHGDSNDDFRNYTLENAVSDIEDAYKYCMNSYPFDREKVGFIGWSMGAKIGNKFLTRHPEIKAMVLLNPAGDNGKNALINSETPAMDYLTLEEKALKEGEALNAEASELFETEMFMSKAFFEQMVASVTGDEIKAFVDAGKKALMIYGDSDSVINSESYAWLRDNSGIEYVCIPGMNHDLGLESERPDFTRTVVDLAVSFIYCYS